MVEVHLDGVEAATAVGARSVAQLVQEFNSRSLPARHALDLPLPMGRVVANVCGPLAGSRGHAS